MLLHEAIGKALEELPDKSGSYKEIASIISRDGTYVRKDGFPPPSSQISARANNYQQYFEKIGGGIKLIRTVQ
jgi:hypothetical protein